MAFYGHKILIIIVITFTAYYDCVRTLIGVMVTMPGSAPKAASISQKTV